MTLFRMSNMDQTRGPVHRASSTAPSLPEDMLSLDTTSDFSSPMSATLSYGSHTRAFPSSTGLGITGCGLEPGFNNMNLHPHNASFTLAQQTASQIAPSDDFYSIPVKVDDFSNASYYGMQNPMPDNTPSPMSYYGSHTMSASPSYNSPMEPTSLQAPFSTQVQGYWAPTTYCGPTTPPEMGSNPANAMFEHWGQNIYPLSVGTTSSALPMSSSLPFTPNTSYASSGATDESPVKGALDTSPIATLVPPRSSKKITERVVPKGKKSKDSDSLRKARASVSRKRSRPDQGYACRECGSKFTRRSNCSAHEKNHNPENKKSFPCGKCSKTFGRNADLNRHIETVGEAT